MKKWAWIRVIYRCNIDQTTPWQFNWSEGDSNFLLAANIISSDDIMKTLATITIAIGITILVPVTRIVVPLPFRPTSLFAHGDLTFLREIVAEGGTLMT